MANNYPNGAGGTLGDNLATCKPVLTSGAIWYIGGSGGTDAASPAGQNREKPLATLAQALTNAASGDIIVLLSGASLTLTAAHSLTGHVLVGEGALTGLPTATIGFDASGELRLTAQASSVFGIKFTERTGASSTARITISAAQCVVRGCTMECGPSDTGPGILLSGALTGVRLETTVFTSTATLVGSQPAVAVQSSAAQTDLRLNGLTFDAGTVGFSNYYALDLSTGAHVRLRAEGISLLRGADVTINASAIGYFNPELTTGGSRIVW